MPKFSAVECSDFKALYFFLEDVKVHKNSSTAQKQYSKYTTGLSWNLF